MTNGSTRPSPSSPAWQQPSLRQPLSSATTAGAAGRQAYWYVFILIALPLLAIPLCILLGKSDFFMHHGASVWVKSNDAVFSQADRRCKVVIFGDSTAMTGIDPDVVEQGTGLQTCNISVTNAVLTVTDHMTLDYYLAHNARPQVILVQLSPEGFQQNAQAWNRTIYAEGLLELLRHTSPSQARTVLWHHPKEALTFAGYAAGFTAWYGIKRAIYRTTNISLEDDRVRIRNGFFTPPVPARTRCESDEDAASSTRPTSAREVVDEYRHYSNRGTVLVNVAPIPACDRNLPVYQRELSGVTSNALLALPIQMFNDQRHFTAGGSRIVSRMVADQVNHVMGHALWQTTTAANVAPGHKVLKHISDSVTTQP